MGSKDFYEDPSYAKKLDPARPLNKDDLLLIVVGETLSGKTALVNALEYPRVTCGTWMGSTVPRVAVDVDTLGRCVRVLDMPGAHGVSVEEIEELVRVDDGVPTQRTAILYILNANSVLRSLPFLMELIELGLPVVVGMRSNSGDTEVNVTVLQNILNVPILPDVGKLCLDIDNIARVALNTEPSSFVIRYGKTIENALEEISAELPYNTVRWLGLAALKGQPVNLPEEAQIKATRHIINWRDAGMNIAQTVSYVRSQVANGMVMEAKGRTVAPSKFVSWLGTILDSSFGLVIALIITIAMLLITFSLAKPWVGFVNEVVAIVAGWLSMVKLAPMLNSYLSRVLISGIGSLVSCMPLVLSLYFTINFLEESGITARLSRWLKNTCVKFNISERIVHCLMQSLGCTLCGLKTVENLPVRAHQVRLALALPFVPCVGKLVVLTCLAAIFCPKYASLVVCGIYVLSLVIAIAVLILSKYLPMEEATAEDEEIAALAESNIVPYHMPRITNLLGLSIAQTWNFFAVAVCPVFVATTCVWLLISMDYYSKFAGWFTFLFKPLHFAEPRMIGTVLFGIFGKETMLANACLSYLVNDPAPVLDFVTGLKAIGTAFVNAFTAMIKGIFSFYSISDCYSYVPAVLAKKIAPMFSFSKSLPLMVFISLYNPCLPLGWELFKVVGSKLMAVQMVAQFVIAWVVTWMICLVA